MTSFALTLVLVAAALHATWNLLAKRAQGGIAFIYLYFVGACVLYAPVVAVATYLHPPHLGPIAIAFIIGNGVLHLIYFTLLQRGYQIGDLSLVYPLARGTGPLLATVAAIVFFGERPSPVALSGVLLIIGGVFLASGLHVARDARTRLSVAYGLATGTTIAAYTLWDKHAVAALAISPIVYDYWGNIARTVLTTPLVAGRRAEMAEAWRRYKWEALGIALLSPLAYLLVLWALIWTPVSYVAPARELSILFGTLLGVHVFSERGRARARFAGAGLMLAGIVALARG